MADFPYLPLFTDAIMADCGHLTDAEFGLYVRILMTMWRTPSCQIPADADWLEKRFKLPITVVGVILAEFCSCDGNFWSQKRLLREKDFVNKTSKRQSVRAKSRWNKDKPDATAMQALHRSGNAPTPTPISLKKERKEGVFSETKQEGKKSQALKSVTTSDPDDPEWFCGRIIKFRKKQFDEFIAHVEEWKQYDSAQLYRKAQMWNMDYEEWLRQLNESVYRSREQVFALFKKRQVVHRPEPPPEG